MPEEQIRTTNYMIPVKLYGVWTPQCLIHPMEDFTNCDWLRFIRCPALWPFGKPFPWKRQRIMLLFETIIFSFLYFRLVDYSFPDLVRSLSEYGYDIIFFRIRDLNFAFQGFFQFHEGWFMYSIPRHFGKGTPLYNCFPSLSGKPFRCPQYTHQWFRFQMETKDASRRPSTKVNELAQSVLCIGIWVSWITSVFGGLIWYPCNSTMQLHQLLSFIKKTLFLDSSIRFCFFHIAMCLWRYLNKSTSVSPYITKSSIQALNTSCIPWKHCGMWD